MLALALPPMKGGHSHNQELDTEGRLALMVLPFGELLSLTSEV